MVVTIAEGRLVVHEPALAPGLVVRRLDVDGAPAGLGEPVDVPVGTVPVAIEGTLRLPRVAAHWRLSFPVAVAAGQMATVAIRAPAWARLRPSALA